MRNRNTRRTKKKGPEAIFVTKMTDNFPKLMSRHGITHLKGQGTPSGINVKKNLYVGISFSNYRK